MKRLRLPQIEWTTADSVGYSLMLAFVLLLVVFGELPWEDSSPRAASPTAIVAEISPPQEIITATQANLDQFWHDQFAHVGASAHYVSPQLVVFDPAQTGETSACARRLRDDDPARYCSQGRTIYINQPYLERMEGKPWSPVWLQIILAHEWGHHIRYLIGPEAVASDAREQQSRELQAYCAAGLWIAVAIASGEVTPDELERFKPMLADSVGHEQTHGTGAQRLAALERGLAGSGPVDCDYGWPFANRPIHFTPEGISPSVITAEPSRASAPVWVV